MFSTVELVKLKQFVVHRLLGMGGFGAVYSVWDSQSNLEVALKLTLTDGREQQDRFRREFQILNTSNHQNMVKVFRFGGPISLTNQDGHSGKYSWYTMELCDESVHKSIMTGKLSLEHRVKISLDLLDVLAYVGERNIGHRDIKLMNLFMKGDRVKLGDFGIARAALHGLPFGTKLTKTGSIIGTPQYFSPEYLSGAGVSDVRLADQYAAGIVIYQLLSNGQWPYDFGDESNILAMLRAHATDLPKQLVIPERSMETFPRLDAVISKMLQKNPASRFSSASACMKSYKVAIQTLGV